jgi:hypothetical protein
MTKESYLGLLVQMGILISHLLLKLPRGFLNTVIPPQNLHQWYDFGP